MRDSIVLLSAKAAKDLLQWASWGYLDVQTDPAEGVIVVTHFSDRRRLRLPVQEEWKDRHYLRSADIARDVGAWYRCHEDVVGLHAALLARQLGTDPQTLASLVPTGWRHPTADRHSP